MNGTIRHALVTGASGGVGAATCRMLAGRGIAVTAVARDSVRLERVVASMPGAVAAVACDLADPAGVEHLIGRVQCADLLVNCAGSMTVGRLSDRPWDDVRREIMLEAVAVARLCQHYGAGMAADGHGSILNFASTAAARPAPLIATYAASKAFVLHLSRSLAAEWRSSGVTVTCCVPGPIATGLAARGGLGARGGADPAMVARSALGAVAAGRSVCYPDLAARLRHAAFRLAPPRILERLAAARYGRSTP